MYILGIRVGVLCIRMYVPTSDIQMKKTYLPVAAHMCIIITCIFEKMSEFQALK